MEVSTGKLCGNAGLMTPEHRYELEDGWANAHVGLKSLDFVFSCDLLLLNLSLSTSLLIVSENNDDPWKGIIKA